MTTQLTDDRETALKIGYRATDWGTPIPFDDYAEAVKAWTIKAVMRDEKCIGAVYRLGDEVHASILLEWRGKWATRGLLEQIFEGDRVTTKVSQGHDHMYGILTRLGFKQSSDGLLTKEN